MALKRRSKREGKKNLTDSSDETRVGTARAWRIQIEPFDAFSSKRNQEKMALKRRSKREGKKNLTDSSDETRVGTARAWRIQIEPFDAFSSKRNQEKMALKRRSKRENPRERADRETRQTAEPHRPQPNDRDITLFRFPTVNSVRAWRHSQTLIAREKRSRAGPIRMPSLLQRCT